jgi:pseudouridine-5'-phosphate glycosidase
MTVEVSPDVADALASSEAVVALESTLLCHGLPRPQNLALAFELEHSVRSEGAVPATVDGHIKVGLSDDELRELLDAPEVAKCTTRDLPLALTRGGFGATTIAATVFVAARLGIKVMATGGLGGVHHGGELSMDVSADLEELARSRVAVICSGIKSILDQGRTLERLESLGVPVIGYGCHELPGFYTAQTGLVVPAIDDIAALRQLCRAHETLGLPGGIVIVQPPPPEQAMPKAAVDRLVDGARQAAAHAGIHGADQTPFMLRHMASQSGGRTVEVNQALALANARLASRLAVALTQRAPTRLSLRRE